MYLGKGESLEEGRQPPPSTLDYRVGLTCPLAEGARVARRLAVAQYLQNKRGETRSPTALSIRDDCHLRCDPFGIQKGSGLSRRLQRLAVGVKEIGPLQMNGPWQVP